MGSRIVNRPPDVIEVSDSVSTGVLLLCRKFYGSAFALGHSFPSSAGSPSNPTRQTPWCGRYPARSSPLSSKNAGRPRHSRRGWIGIGRAGLDAQATNQTQVLPEPSMGEGKTAVEARRVAGGCCQLPAPSAPHVRLVASCGSSLSCFISMSLVVRMMTPPVHKHAILQ
jgi:hypothetical protein